jgi:hypothetical protein
MSALHNWKQLCGDRIMPIIIFWLIVVPVTLAFTLGFMANLFRTLASQAIKAETSSPPPTTE